MRKLIMENGIELIFLEHCSEVSFSGNDFSGENTSVERKITLME